MYLFEFHSISTLIYYSDDRNDGEFDDDDDDGGDDFGGGGGISESIWLCLINADVECPEYTAAKEKSPNMFE